MNRYKKGDIVRKVGFHLPLYTIVGDPSIANLNSSGDYVGERYMVKYIANTGKAKFAFLFAHEIELIYEAAYKE